MVVMVLASTPAIGAAFEPDLFRVVTPGEIRPRTGSFMRVAPAVIVVVIVISALVIIWLGA